MHAFQLQLSKPKMAKQPSPVLRPTMLFFFLLFGYQCFRLYSTMQAYCSRGTKKIQEKGAARCGNKERDIQYWQKAQSSHLYPAWYNPSPIHVCL